MNPHERALDHLKVMVSNCQGCGLSETRNKTAFSRGDGSSGLCIVGEAPGADEDVQGEPFVGSSGKMLDKMLESHGFDKKTVYICNVVKCRPPENRVPQVAEIVACSGYLFRQIQLVKPRVILTLGQTAGRTILGAEKWPGMILIRGKWHRALDADVLPTFHPAYLFRVPSAKAAVHEDLRAVAERLELATGQS